jgi:hypothetical protein
LEIAVAELVVIGDIAPTDASGFDSDLEFMGPWVGDGTSFLIGVLAQVYYTWETPTTAEEWD